MDYSRKSPRYGRSVAANACVCARAPERRRASQLLREGFRLVELLKGSTVRYVVVAVVLLKLVVSLALSCA